MDKKKQITANLGRPAYNHEESQIPKVTVQLPMKKGNEKVWVSATMTGPLAEKFKDAQTGDRMTAYGELKTVQGKGGKDVLVMDVEKAFSHKNIDLEATVKKAPELGTKENSPARAFTMAQVDGKDVIVNLSEFKDRDALMTLKKGDKIQIQGDARVSDNINPRPGTHDYKYEVVNPTITTPGQEKAVEQVNDRAAADAKAKAPEAEHANSNKKSEVSPPSPTDQGVEVPKQFIAGTDNHSLFKNGKQYEVIKNEGNNNYSLQALSTSRNQGLKDLKSNEIAHQKQQGVPEPKVKAKTTTTRQYPPTVDRSAVKLAEKATKPKGIEV